MLRCERAVYIIVVFITLTVPRSSKSSSFVVGRMVVFFDVIPQGAWLLKFLVAILTKRQNENTEDKCARQNLNRAGVGAVSCVYALVLPQVEVEGESFSTSLKTAVERFLPCVNQVVSL